MLRLLHLVIETACADHDNHRASSVPHSLPLSWQIVALPLQNVRQYNSLRLSLSCTGF